MCLIGEKELTPDIVVYTVSVSDKKALFELKKYSIFNSIKKKDRYQKKTIV